VWSVQAVVTENALPLAGMVVRRCKICTTLLYDGQRKRICFKIVINERGVIVF
jgi:hypothetical protein